MNADIQRALHHLKATIARPARFSRPQPTLCRVSPIALSRIAPPSRCLSSPATPVQQAPVIPELSDHSSISFPARQRNLPVCCPGCGALTQDELKNEAGYYSRSRKTVHNYQTQASEDAIYTTALNNLSADTLSELSIDNASSAAVNLPSLKSTVSVPYCDRCHNLMHHNVGVPIIHPSLAAIEATITESPHSTNHIWHVVDAADFPMSLVLDMDKRLSLAYLRTRNRRAKDRKYVSGKQADMSFIVTRSDLLAPQKEQVDNMMPRLREILRDALGVYGKQMRLGNVHVVSAERGWWTKSIKQKLLDGMGANWLVGKVNVGKSKLFETIFPKGTNKRAGAEKNCKEVPISGANCPMAALSKLAEESNNESVEHTSLDRPPEAFQVGETELEPELSDSFSLLPPAQPLTQYPVMPVISGLPGTTASPIRIPYRNGKSELVDLPGLHRGSLEDFVQPDKRLALTMTDRVTPERLVIKPGHSLLLGGLIRITPLHDDIVIMAHAFTPLTAHLTSNLKAEAIHTGQIESGIETIVRRDARNKMASAGTFKLTDDVTKVYAGPLTRRDAAGLKPERLPFIVYGTDILIEGVGWVELQAQVRKPKSPIFEQELLSPEKRALNLEFGVFKAEEDTGRTRFPEVEIFSPEGKHIGQRACLCAFSSGAPRNQKVASRPRRSMVSVKNQRKPKDRSHAD